MVTEAGRGTLPYALIHGEPLVACAAWALGEAGVTLVDVGTPWARIADSGQPVVLHDPLCPMTPASFVVDCLTTAVELDRVVVGVRPVTDTVKESDQYVGATVDRGALLQVASPVVLPPSVAAKIGEPPTEDFTRLVTWLAQRVDVEPLVAPVAAGRVASEDDLRVLEALTGLGVGPADSM